MVPIIGTVIGMWLVQPFTCMSLAYRRIGTLEASKWCALE